MTYLTYSGTSGQEQNNSLHLHIPIQWYKAVSWTPYITSISQSRRNWQKWKKLRRTVNFQHAHHWYSKFYKPSNIWLSNRVIILFRERVVFKQHIHTLKFQKENILPLWKNWLHIWRGSILRERPIMCHSWHDEHVTVKQVTKKVKSGNHKLYMDSSISSPDIY